MRSDQNRAWQKGNRMTPAAVAADAQFLLHQLSLPIEPTDSIKARMQRAIRASGLSPRKAIRIWYRHACTIAAHEYLSLVAAVNEHAEVFERAAERNLQLANQSRGAGVTGGQFALAIDQEVGARDLGVDQKPLAAAD